jgi:hypothetical protein
MSDSNHQIGGKLLVFFLNKDFLYAILEASVGDRIIPIIWCMNQYSPGPVQDHHIRKLVTYGVIADYECFQFVDVSNSC